MLEPHVTEEELILHYYGEPLDAHAPAGSRSSQQVEAHLAQCAACRRSLDELGHVLSLVAAQRLPEPLDGLEQRVWARLAPEVASKRRAWWAGVVAAAPRWAWAGGVAALVIAAFVAGRVTGPDGGAPATPQVANAEPGDAAGRMMTIAVGDHLDESQFVLLELLNADTSHLTSIASEQRRARDLVAANRLYRQTALHAGDEGVREVLDALERVLLEIANAPPDVSARELAALRADIEQRGIVFRVRVVAAAMRAREQQDVMGTRVGP